MATFRPGPFSLSRRLATAAGPILDSRSQVYNVFDRNAKRMQKDRAAKRESGARSRQTDYLFDEVADRLAERLMDIKRNFPHIIDIGSGAGHLPKLFEAASTSKATLVESSYNMLHRDDDSEFQVEVERKHIDEELLLHHFGSQAVPAITSCLSLHWTNDLPGVLTQIREILQPDGVFVGAMLGGDTLFELRTALQLAEQEREGGVSIRVSPMTDTRDVSNLLGRAGFTLTTVDVDEVTIAYPSMFELLEDLRNMGNSNAVVDRRAFLNRDSLAAASAIYKALHGLEDGTIPATFHVIYMIGWRPSPTQPKPLERGSGKTKLTDVL